MMKRKLLIIAAVLGCVLYASADSQTVKVKDVKTTVFPNGAELTQSAQLLLMKGQNQVIIEGLSPYIDKQSLQLSVSGGAVITSFSYSTNYLSLPQNRQRQQQLQDSLALLKILYATCETKVATNTRLQELLQQGVSNSLQTENHGLTTDAIEKQLLYYQQRQLQLAKEQAELAMEEQSLNEKIKAYEQQLRQEGQQSQRTGVVSLIIQSPKQMQVQTEVKYFTTNAHWTPYYDLLVTEVGQPVKLMLKAKVGQKTGIDWNKIALTLSTNAPSKSNTLPVLKPWLLKQQEERNVSKSYYRRAAIPEMREEAMMGSADMEVEEDEPVYEVGQNEQSLTTSYNISLPYSIEGNNKEQTVELKEIVVTDVDYTYLAIPKSDAGVYLTADIRNWEKLSLLSGKANLTYGDTYYGQTDINTESTSKTLRLTLGTDKQIVVSRELLAEQSQTRTVGSNKTIERTYLITIRNNKKQPVTIVVKEPYPVSSAKEIQVELNKNTTAFTENDKARGILSYSLTLQPAETQSVQIGYQVKYPKDWKINL